MPGPRPAALCRALPTSVGLPSRPRCDEVNGQQVRCSSKKKAENRSCILCAHAASILYSYRYQVWSADRRKRREREDRLSESPATFCATSSVIFHFSLVFFLVFYYRSVRKCKGTILILILIFKHSSHFRTARYIRTYIRTGLRFLSCFLFLTQFLIFLYFFVPQEKKPQY